ncbi:CYTH domain-containing protein [Yinghuangia seranimata]|uniref:CYTH domain-containing protein n=1 Tax=Yinghuangia seranimata TaxID=408067 RepID=UPI00248B26B3|nr:CYTH domain-containing protein [Yinghuangia seranimata]MDI2124820.1 CYTH domain-containing protein [Yinghuangia seranimata]
MGTEIERKFLVDGEPPLPAEGKAVRQGYIAPGDPEVRVRGMGGTHTICVKTGSGLVRGETEVEISADQFAALWPTTEGARVEKTRFKVDVGGVTAEVDVYEGALAGLRTVEVEFASLGEADAFSPPAWFGREVTGVDAYGNRNLARHGVPAE